MVHNNTIISVLFLLLYKAIEADAVLAISLYEESLASRLGIKAQHPIILATNQTSSI